MTQWYKITAPLISSYVKVYAAAERLGLNPTDEVELLSFIVHCAPKHLTLFRLEFPDVAVYCYRGLGEVVQALAEDRSLRDAGDRHRARLSDLF